MTEAAELSEDDFYDGPVPNNVRPLFNAPIEELRPRPNEHPTPMPGPKPKAYLAAITMALDVLSFRLIIVLSIAASSGLFAVAVWTPDPWRLGGAAAFSLIVTLPAIWLYGKR